MPDSELAGLAEDTTPDATDNVYAQDAAGNVDKRVPLSALTTITTTATTVNAAGAVMESDYDANTILAATTDNTPVALTVAEQTLVGRITGGNITALSDSQVRTLLGLVIGTNVQAYDADLTDIAAIADAQGDIIVRGAAGWERLAKSATATDVLTAGASQPAWAAAAGGPAALNLATLYALTG